MHTTTRLLLPFSEGIHSLALDSALQVAKQCQAMLVPLALIPVQPKRRVRLELIEQAQDFLVLIQRKASRQGVSIEPAQLYTPDCVRSIEAFAHEMHCEAVLLFLDRTDDVLLGHAEIQALLARGLCNIYLVLLPEKHMRRVWGAPLKPARQQQEVAEHFLPDVLGSCGDNRAESTIRMIAVKLPQKGIGHGTAQIPDVGRV